MRILLTLLLALIALPAPARADDIAATGRGVVRVVLIASVNGRVVGYSHGSGVAVAPDRVVTNAHVVELSQRFPDNVTIGSRARGCPPPRSTSARWRTAIRWSHWAIPATSISPPRNRPTIISGR